jgi:hypothetical protein
MNKLSIPFKQSRTLLVLQVGIKRGTCTRTYFASILSAGRHIHGKKKWLELDPEQAPEQLIPTNYAEDDVHGYVAAAAIAHLKGDQVKPMVTLIITVHRIIDDPVCSGLNQIGCKIIMDMGSKMMMCIRTGIGQDSLNMIDNNNSRSINALIPY